MIVADALAKGGTTPGLTSAEAADGLRHYGPNQIHTEQRFRLLREGLGMLILLVAAAVSGLLGDVPGLRPVIEATGFRSEQLECHLKAR